jgi:hypothetical protein
MASLLPRLSMAIFIVSVLNGSSSDICTCSLASSDASGSSRQPTPRKHYYVCPSRYLGDWF